MLTDVTEVGEVWANMLHNVNAALVDKYGFSTTAMTNPDGNEGNIVFLHLFIDALALQPVNPTCEPILFYFLYGKPKDDLSVSIQSYFHAKRGSKPTRIDTTVRTKKSCGGRSQVVVLVWVLRIIMTALCCLHISNRSLSTVGRRSSLLLWVRTSVVLRPGG